MGKLFDLTGKASTLVGIQTFNFYPNALDNGLIAAQNTADGSIKTFNEKSIDTGTDRGSVAMADAMNPDGSITANIDAERIFVDNGIHFIRHADKKADSAASDVQSALLAQLTPVAPVATAPVAPAAAPVAPVPPAPPVPTA